MLYIQGIHKRMVQFQKLTRNLFLMRYQQFASHAYCGAAGRVSKMASQQENAFCVLRFEVSRSVITVEREFRAWFRKDAPWAWCVFSKPCTKILSLAYSWLSSYYSPLLFALKAARRDCDFITQIHCTVPASAHTETF